MDFKEDIETFIRLIDNWSSIDNYWFFPVRKEGGRGSQQAMDS
jgi:hypothetical protein